VDQVGRGRSPYVEAVYGAKRARTPKQVERDFIAYERYNLSAGEIAHAVAGSGTVGDPLFDQFMAQMLPGIEDSDLREAVNRDATIALLTGSACDRDAAFAIRLSGVSGGGRAAATGKGPLDGRGRHRVVLRCAAGRRAGLVQGRSAEQAFG
jgi:hypothetical protein